MPFTPDRDPLLPDLTNRNRHKQLVKQNAVENPATDRPQQIAGFNRRPGTCPTCESYSEYKDADLGTCPRCTPRWKPVLPSEETQARRAAKKAARDDAAALAATTARAQRKAERAAERLRRMGGAQ